MEANEVMESVKEVVSVGKSWKKTLITVIACIAVAVLLMFGSFCCGYRQGRNGISDSGNQSISRLESDLADANRHIQSLQSDLDRSIELATNNGNKLKSIREDLKAISDDYDSAAEDGFGAIEEYIDRTTQFLDNLERILGEEDF